MALLKWFLGLFRVKQPAPSQPTSLGLAALSIAVTQTGRGESEANNMGPDVESYRRGKGPRGPWCAAFVSWCLEEAAAQLGLEPPARSHGAKRLFRNLKRYGAVEVTQPAPGDVALWQRGAAGSWKGHIGIVSRASNDGSFWAIEGNRGRFPARVAEFSHQVGEGSLLGFVRLPEADRG